MYGLKTVALRKKQETELEKAEIKMTRFSFGWTGSGMSTSEGQFIRCFRAKVREARLRWFGHVEEGQ